MAKEFIRINVELPGFSQGQQWPRDKAPTAIKWWLENKSILFETPICSLVIEEDKPTLEDKEDAEVVVAEENVLEPEPEIITDQAEPNEIKRRGRPKGSGNIKD